MLILLQLEKMRRTLKGPRDTYTRVWAPFIECVKNGKGEGEGTNTGYVHIWMYVYVYMTENDLQEIKL